MDWQVTESIAVIYASIVATAALALEVRRWFEFGPRVSLTLINEAKLYGGIVPDDSTYLHARITNRGALPTTVTNYALHEYKTGLHRLFRRPARSAIVPNPMNGPPLPYVLAPGTEWAGSTPYNDELFEWASSGRLFVAIYHSHSSRPVQGKVKVAPDKSDRVPDST